MSFTCEQATQLFKTPTGWGSFLSATLQSKQRCSSPPRVKPFTCYRCHSCCCSQDYHRHKMKIPRAPAPVSVTDSPCLLIESIQKPHSEGHEMFCRVENEPPHFIKERRQGTRGNHPSAAEVVVCAGKISLTPSSICHHICTNLLFSGVNCCNLAFFSPSNCLICIYFRKSFA